MKSPRARLLPRGTDHGKPVVHMCHVCFAMRATYPGVMPKRWVKLDMGWEFCPRCARREEAANDG